jgi:ubiquitin C-terminal hydrolase
MEPISVKHLPDPFVMNNTGAICYFNSLLQALASCTSLTVAVLRNKRFMHRTPTGAAFYQFVEAYATLEGARSPPAENISLMSATVQQVLSDDLRRRRPDVDFGGGQQSASEALVHLLDMMEPPKAADDTEQVRGPITELFLHRYRLRQQCGTCRHYVTTVAADEATDSATDHSVQFNLFGIDTLKVAPTSPQEFGEYIRLSVSPTSDYMCPVCEKRVPVLYRFHQLTLTPEIVVCVFPVYGAYRPARTIPASLEFPTKVKGRSFYYVLVGKVQHTGSLNGGHYTADVLRRKGIYTVNDAAPPRPCGKYPQSPNTYLALYHYWQEGATSKPAPASKPVQSAMASAAERLAAAGEMPPPRCEQQNRAGGRQGQVDAAVAALNAMTLTSEEITASKEATASAPESEFSMHADEWETLSIVPM